MAIEWTDRTIRGPTAEYLTADELRKLFGLPADWLEDKVRDGTIPPPIRVTARTVMYTWRHAVFLQLWLEMNPGGPADGEKKGGKVSPP